MASVGLARPFFSFMGILSGPLGLGMQLLCSNYIGKSEIEKAQKIFSGVLLVGTIVSLIIMFVGYFK